MIDSASRCSVRVTGTILGPGMQLEQNLDSSHQSESLNCQCYEGKYSRGRGQRAALPQSSHEGLPEEPGVCSLLPPFGAQDWHLQSTPAGPEASLPKLLFVGIMFILIVRAGRSGHTSAAAGDQPHYSLIKDSLWAEGTKHTHRSTQTRPLPFPRPEHKWPS